MYLALGDAVGTREARELGHRLVAWHDSMVKHLRKASLGGAECGDDCPHVDARVLWAEALEVFGDEAHKLAFLRTHSGIPAEARVGTATEARV
jgi:hypothetical protein